MKNRLRELRLAKKLTLEELADLVGSSNQQISQLETGRRRLNVDWLERFGRALECHPLDILDDGARAQTDDEQELLDVFRALNADQRRSFLGAAKSLVLPFRQVS